MSRRGFTIAELIIVIAVMGILLTLGVVNLRGQQSSARDSERNLDVESIAQHLETYYTSGNDTNAASGTYPSTDMTSSLDNLLVYLRDLDLKSATAPTLTTENSEGSSLIAATNNMQTPTTVTPTLTTPDMYVYQPLKNDGNLCTLTTESCVKFNLYYRLENATADCTAGNNNICILKSKHQ